MKQFVSRSSSAAHSARNRSKQMTSSNICNVSNNKAQVSLFVIIGIALLTLIGITFLLLEQPVNTGGEFNTNTLDTFMSSCIEQVSEEGLRLLGRQGGYYSLEDRYFEESIPWRSEGVVSGPQKVPYWYHVAPCNNPYGCIEFVPPPLCRVSDECIIPSGEDIVSSSSASSASRNSRNSENSIEGRSIEAQLERYVDDNLASCLKNFEELENSFAIEPLPGESEAFTSDVTFTANDILVKVTYPMTITDFQSGNTVNLESFSGRLDIDFEEIYRLAYDVALAQLQTNFIEDNLLHYLGLYQGEAPLLPPFSSQEFLGKRNVWIRSEVQERLEDEILPYMNFLQVVNAYTGYAPITQTGLDPADPYTPYAEGLFLYSEINLGEEVSYPDLGVSFFYPYSPIYLNINDRELLQGDEISTDNLFLKLAGFFLTMYNFHYDIAFPLMTTIQAPKAFDGDGYMFSFALEGTVINNKPMGLGRTFIDAGEGSLNAPELSNQGEGEVVTISVFSHQTPEQNRIAIEDARLYYDCGWSYNLGSTNEEGVWVGKLPYCPVGGSVRVSSSEEFYGSAIAFDNDGSSFATQNKELTISLWPVKQKTVRVMRRTVDDILRFGFNQCSSLDACRSELAFEESLPFSYVVDENGSVHVNMSECGSNCSLSEGSADVSQYAMVTLRRNAEASVGVSSASSFVSYKELPIADPVPLIGTISIGKVGSAALDARLTQEQYDELLASGALSQEEYTILVTQSAQDLAQEFVVTEEADVGLVPGVYDLEALLFYDGQISIPQEIRKEGPIFARETVVLPAQEFSTWLQGGASLSGDNSVTFTAEDIYSDKDLIVYVLEQPLPVTWSILEDYKPIEEFQEGKEVLIQPEFE